MDSRRESGVGSDSDTMAELTILLTTEIPEGRSNLADSHTNLGNSTMLPSKIFGIQYVTLINVTRHGCFRTCG